MATTCLVTRPAMRDTLSPRRGLTRKDGTGDETARPRSLSPKEAGEWWRKNTVNVSELCGAEIIGFGGVGAVEMGQNERPEA